MRPAEKTPASMKTKKVNVVTHTTVAPGKHQKVIIEALNAVSGAKHNRAAALV
jgi:translation elongation factor P/translation initiation factor 5A